MPSIRSTGEPCLAVSIAPACTAGHNPLTQPPLLSVSTWKIPSSILCPPNVTDDWVPPVQREAAETIQLHQVRDCVSTTKPMSVMPCTAPLYGIEAPSTPSHEWTRRQRTCTSCWSLIQTCHANKVTEAMQWCKSVMLRLKRCSCAWNGSFSCTLTRHELIQPDSTCRGTPACRGNVRETRTCHVTIAEQADASASLAALCDDLRMARPV